MGLENKRKGEGFAELNCVFEEVRVKISEYRCALLVVLKS